MEVRMKKHVLIFFLFFAVFPYLTQARIINPAITLDETVFYAEPKYVWRDSTISHCIPVDRKLVALERYRRLSYSGNTCSITINFKETITEVIVNYKIGNDNCAIEDAFDKLLNNQRVDLPNFKMRDHISEDKEFNRALNDCKNQNAVSLLNLVFPKSKKLTLN